MKILNTKIAILSIVIGSLIGCTELETEPADAITTIDTEDEVSSVLFNSYTNLYSMFGNNGNYLTMQEIASDEAVIPTRGSDWGDGGTWRRLHQHRYNADEDYINTSWNSCYTAINQINNGFSQYEGQTNLLPPETRAELRGLRTLYYFFLIDTFGNVPIITEEGNQGQKSRDEVYNFILNEIDAIQDVIRKDSRIGRINYWTMQALKAKMLINTEVYTDSNTDWQSVVDACDEIINEGPYSFSSSYASIFNDRNDGNSEHIFAIPYDEVFVQGFNLGQMTLHYESQSTYGAAEQPWNGYSTLADFYNMYIDTTINPGPTGQVVGLDESGSMVKGTLDERLINFIVGQQFNQDGEMLNDESAEDPDGPPLNFTPHINELEPSAYRQAGARIGKYQFYDGMTSNLNNDFPVFRFTDILLMKAEALHRMNPGNGEALSIVNQVRNRADVDDFDVLSDENLLQERGRELFFEVWRRNDQIRFGTYNDEWNFHPSYSEQEFDNLKLFPIPRVQIEGSGLTQNPGYN